MEQVLDLAGRLSRASVRRFSNPYAEFQWPESRDPSAWYFAPQLISLAGTEVYGELTLEEQKRLAFWEAVNFFSLNIHGEKALLQGMSQRLYSRWPAQVSDYLHHFVDEENKHMSLFGGFCMQYAGKVYRAKSLTVPREFQAGEEDFLFFAKVVIFEELVDYYNLSMAQDARLHPLAQQINRYHHNDETRHLAFGRALSQQIYDHYAGQWDAETRQRVSDYLGDYLIATWREYYNPDVYTDAGLDDAYALYRLAWEAPASRERRRAASEKCVRFLVDGGMLLEEPNL